jgi:hypothetical protein
MKSIPPSERENSWRPCRDSLRFPPPPGTAVAAFSMPPLRGFRWAIPGSEPQAPDPIDAGVGDG